MSLIDEKKLEGIKTGDRISREDMVKTLEILWRIARAAQKMKYAKGPDIPTVCEELNEALFHLPAEETEGK